VIPEQPELPPEYDWLSPWPIGMSLVLAAGCAWLLAVSILALKRIRTHPEWVGWSRLDVAKRFVGVSLLILVLCCALIALFMIYWVRLRR